MNKISLYDDNLTELTESDLTALCYLKGFKPNELNFIDLAINNLKDINFITETTLFINLKELNISVNKITNITNIKYLSNLEILNISSLKLDNEKKTVELLKTMKTLKTLYSWSTFKAYTYKQLKKELPNIKIY